MLNEKDGLFKIFDHTKFCNTAGKSHYLDEVDPVLKILCDSFNNNEEVAGLLKHVGGDTAAYNPDYSTPSIFGVLSFAKLLLINLSKCVDLKVKKEGVIRRTILNNIPFSDQIKKRIEKLPLDTTAEDVFNCFKARNNSVRGLRFHSNSKSKYEPYGGIYINARKIYKILCAMEKVGSDDCSLKIIGNAIKEIDEVLNTMLSNQCVGIVYLRSEAKEEVKKDKVLTAYNPELVGLVDELASYAVLTHNYARTLTSSRDDALICDAFKEAGFIKYLDGRQVTVQGNRLRNIYYDPLRFNGEPSLWQVGFYLNKSVGVNHKVGEDEAMEDNTQTLTLNRPATQQENKIITVGNKKAYQVGKGDYKHRNGVIKDGIIIKEEKAEMNKVYTYPVGDKNILADLEDLLNSVIDNPDVVDKIVDYLAENSPAAHFISEMIGCGEISDEESLRDKLYRAAFLSQRIFKDGKNANVLDCEHRVFSYLNVDYPKPIFGKELFLKQVSFCLDVAAREIEDILNSAEEEAEEEKEEVIAHDAAQEHAEEDCEPRAQDHRDYDELDFEELTKLVEERRKKEAELDAELAQAEEEKRKELIAGLRAADKRIEGKEARLAKLREK